MKQPEIVSGIELRVNGHKIGLESHTEYLETLVENLTETFKKRRMRRNDGE